MDICSVRHEKLPHTINLGIDEKRFIYVIRVRLTTYVNIGVTNVNIALTYVNLT